MVECVFCSCKTFVDFAGRDRAKCANCHSLERTRIIGLFLKTRNILFPGARILHFAPEKPLHDFIVKSSPGEYIKADIRSQVEGIQVTYFDIVKQISSLESKSFDLIIHNHVLEHLRCSDVYVAYHIHRALDDNGLHIFSVPIWPGKSYKADFNEYDPAILQQRFGQEDHVALYGSVGFDTGLGACMGISGDYDLESQIDKALLDDNNIPKSFRRGLSGSSVFVKRKDEWAFSL